MGWAVTLNLNFLWFFQDQVNAASQVGTYNLEISPRIGRNKAKEQYAFFYRSDRFKVG